jgi:hypothetical protein
MVKDVTAGVELIHRSAQGGCLWGIIAWGCLLREGNGVMGNEAEGACWLKMAADRGDANGQYNYGCCLDRGRGMARDEGLAALYFKLAAEQGHSSGQYNYAWDLENGCGVAQDVAAATHFYHCAAERGNAKGQPDQGHRCGEGQGGRSAPHQVGPESRRCIVALRVDLTPRASGRDGGIESVPYRTVVMTAESRRLSRHCGTQPSDAPDRD